MSGCVRRGVIDYIFDASLSKGSRSILLAQDGDVGIYGMDFGEVQQSSVGIVAWEIKTCAYRFSVYFFEFIFVCVGDVEQEWGRICQLIPEYSFVYMQYLDFQEICQSNILE